jgi:Carboxypeptidase regulatory-like domain
MKRWLCRETCCNWAAGLRLRCFLGRALQIALFCMTLCGASHAQLETNGPIRLASVEGLVVNTWGKPVPNLEVSLSQDAKVVSKTRTDKAGAFEFDHVSGDYLFQVARSEYAPAARQIVARLELVTLAERKKLYVILGPGACMDACSSVLTSKREFDQALQKLNRH